LRREGGEADAAVSSTGDDPQAEDEGGPTMPKNETIRIRVSRRYDAPPERVFDAWLDAEQARHWLFATPEGEMMRAETDPRVGGTFTFTDRRDGEDWEHVGEYLEIDRPRRLVFVFGVPRISEDRDRVTIDVEPRDGGCELTLVHELDSRWAEYEESGREAWEGMLEALPRWLP
jgi:uncharacterized protein YndB with AHSA1/START domain